MTILVESRETTTRQIAIDSEYKSMYANDITKSSYSYLDEYYRKYNITAQSKTRKKVYNSLYWYKNKKG